MDTKGRLLLTYLQNGLPLTSRPFDVLSTKIGIDSAEVLVRIQRLKSEGAFAGIRAILDPRAFHYQGAWVAVKLSSEELESRAEVFWKHPGVVYGCERQHEFNLWFFIAVPAANDLELHVRCLEKLAGAQGALFLPVRKVFKGVDLLSSLDGETFLATGERFEKQVDAEAPAFSKEEIDMIRQLQEPLPLTDEPYGKIAADLGITETQALEQMKSLVKKGCLKRIGSFLKSAGSSPGARSLVVWQIPEEKLERIGPEITGFREVLYADQRPAFTEFPYSFYTMVQAGSAAELETLTERMQERIGKWPYQVLVTTQELKAEPIKYFSKELDQWWRESRHAVEAAFN